MAKKKYDIDYGGTYGVPFSSGISTVNGRDYFLVRAEDVEAVGGKNIVQAIKDGSISAGGAMRHFPGSMTGGQTYETSSLTGDKVADGDLVLDDKGNVWDVTGVSEDLRYFTISSDVLMNLRGAGVEAGDGAPSESLSGTFPVGTVYIDSSTGDLWRIQGA